jgi:hypothetical protein
MQITQYDNQNSRAYFHHTRPELSGTDQFECGGWVRLSGVEIVEPAPLAAGAGVPVPYAVIVCPTGCGATLAHPLIGGSDAQRLHAHVRLAASAHPAQALPDAIESVLAEVAERGGAPSLELALEAHDELARRGQRTTGPFGAQAAAIREAQAAERVATAEREAEEERQRAARETEEREWERKRRAADAAERRAAEQRRKDAQILVDAQPTPELKKAMARLLGVAET